MAVHFHFQAKILIPQKKQLKDFIIGIFKNEARLVETLDFIFCDDAYLLNINQTFLQHDYFTDIITFNMSEAKNKKISGEIYISVDMVSSNSIDFNVEFLNELLRVIFHGVLHLCGYKDKSKKDKLVMRRKEDYYLEMFLVEHF